jgi:hypothetical protein
MDGRIAFLRDGRSRKYMKELISQLVAKADLSEAQAAKVAEVVKVPSLPSCLMRCAAPSRVPHRSGGRRRVRFGGEGSRGKLF